MFRITRRLRKLIGGLVLTGYLAVYSLVAMALGATHIVGLPPWVQMLYYATAGLAWVPPAMIVIWWMQRPDKGE
ncbi:MAG: DUF2842 domain-containing protein [Hyphomicrobiales bacterium]